MPNFSVNKKVYTMTVNEDLTAEITMYGEIVEKQPIEYWSGNPVDGDFIILKDFMNDLENLKNCKSITIRMNSIGGDAGIAILIHNRLRELTANGTSLTCIVDGVAMSGGSLIMCACDNVIVNPSSIIMIHKCWSWLSGNYNADELRKLADSYDAYDKAQASIYMRKSGQNEKNILQMMSDTTYMTGAEALEKGFANSLIENAEPLNISASADRKCLFVKNKHFFVTGHIPQSIPMVTTAKAAEINSKQEVKKAMPEDSIQHEQIKSAIEKERRRIQEIDAFSGLFSAEQIAAAKYENPCSAMELAYRAAQEAAAGGKSYMANMIADNLQSKVDEISAANNKVIDTAQAAEEDASKSYAMAKTFYESIIKKDGGDK